MKLTVTGAEGTKQLMQMVRQRMAANGVRSALRAGASVIAQAIVERTPERPELPSGTALPPGALKADIRVRMKTKDGQSVAIVGPSALTSHVARFVEYGHREVSGGQSKVLANGKTKGSGTEVGFVPADPFIRPGFEASVREAIDAFKQECSAQIGKVAK